MNWKGWLLGTEGKKKERDFMASPNHHRNERKKREKCLSGRVTSFHGILLLPRFSVERFHTVHQKRFNVRRTLPAYYNEPMPQSLKWILRPGKVPYYTVTSLLRITWKRYKLDSLYPGRFCKFPISGNSAIQVRYKGVSVYLSLVFCELMLGIFAYWITHKS